MRAHIGIGTITDLEVEPASLIRMPGQDVCRAADASIPSTVGLENSKTHRGLRSVTQCPSTHGISIT